MLEFEALNPSIFKYKCWNSKRQMLEFEASARKIAACHPLLMLRNLPLIAASLKGRTEYDFSFFRSRNHMTLYNISLGLLEVLKPYIFRKEYQEPLEDALVCYFEMVNAYFTRRDSFSGVIEKFFTFLHEYIERGDRNSMLQVWFYGWKEVSPPPPPPPPPPLPFI